MSLDWIIKFVSEDEPAGPDLEALEDEEFEEYYFDAVGRLPEQDAYFRPDEEAGETRTGDGLYRVTSLSAELSKIDALLQRSRDIRLLVLRAQWCVLAGDLSACINSVQAIADLLEAMSTEAHPSLTSGTRDRLDTLNDLSALGTIVLPLRHLDLAQSGTSLRKIRVVRGEFTPQKGETDLSLDQLLSALASDGGKVTKLSEEIARFNEGLARIENACLSSREPHQPRFQVLKNELSAISGVLSESNPDLELATNNDEADATSDETGSVSGGAAKTSRATRVSSAEDAKVRLAAVERYFCLHEPSSAAVLLVVQAKELIGKSLIDAFDILMPDANARAKVAFAPESGFQIPHTRLRELASQMSTERLQYQTEKNQDEQPLETVENTVQTEEKTQGQAPPTPADVSIKNSNDAAEELLAVESYFHGAEKSSPIPILLGRARSYIGKDFEALMREFVPPQGY